MRLSASSRLNVLELTDFTSSRQMIRLVIVKELRSWVTLIIEQANAIGPVLQRPRPARSGDG
jgi:hypothetical protein